MREVPHPGRGSSDSGDETSRWLACARRGDLDAAWAVSDRIRERTRLFGDPSRPRHEQVLWDGTPIDGRRVLVRCYHGLGDTIQFARYLPALCRRAASVAVWTQDVLRPLLRTLSVNAELLPLHDGDPGVDVDMDVEIMELPYVFRTTLETIPHTVPYLDAAALALVNAGRPRVGVAWRAGDWDRRRSIPFDILGSLLADEGADWYALHHDPRPHERHPRLQYLPTMGLVALARAIRSLDLVITVDTVTAHLAGALGVSTWTLLRREADWRWFEGRTDSPWYPTMRLFRQPVEGDWHSALADVQRSLQPRDVPA
jgi:hypothetical protein